MSIKQIAIYREKEDTRYTGVKIPTPPHWGQNTHPTHLHTHSLDGHAVVLRITARSHEEGSLWRIVNEHTLCRVPVEIGVVPAARVRGGA